MERFKKIGVALLHPPKFLLLLLILASAAGLIVVFQNGWEERPLAGVVYAVSAYTLTVMCIFAANAFSKMYAWAREGLYANAFGKRYLTDTVYKLRVSLYVSLGINLAYSLFKLVLGMYYASFWWGAIAVYYMVLAIMRFLLLRHARVEESEQDQTAEYRRYRLCGILLLLLHLSLTGIIFQMVWQNQSYSYPGMVIYAAAAYTFYNVTISIVDVVRCRKASSPVFSASKNIRFAAALVSLLALETAMLAQFGSSESFRVMMIALTGTAVCLVVLGLSIYMIVRSTRELKKMVNDLQ